jgi:hypothetical protein
MKKIWKNVSVKNSYLCNQLGNALFCVTSGIFAGRAQRDPAKSHELHKIAFPKVLHKVHSRWIFSAKLLSRCKPAPPFLVIFTLSCFIRDRGIESDLTSLILIVSLTCEIKSQIF